MNTYESEEKIDVATLKTDDRYLVPGLMRGLAVLELFDAAHPEMTITEIADKLELNRSSAFRLIYTLEHCGFLRKLSQKTYALDSRVMALGFHSLSKLSLNELAAPVMKALRERVKIAVHLSILDGTDVVFINNLQSMGAFTSTLQIGTRWPAHATVIGQLMLARLSTDEVKQRYLGFKDWRVFSDRTPKSLEELLQRLDEVRDQPFLISWGHYNTDMAACAAPVFNQLSHNVVAVISVSCPITTYTEEAFSGEIAQEVVHAAHQLSGFIYKADS